MSRSYKGLYAGENNGFYGKQHTDETRQKMSEAAKQRHAAEHIGGYKLLIAAVIKQAAKDKAAWFFANRDRQGLLCRCRY